MQEFLLEKMNTKMSFSCVRDSVSTLNLSIMGFMLLYFNRDIWNWVRYLKSYSLKPFNVIYSYRYNY